METKNNEWESLGYVRGKKKGSSSTFKDLQLFVKIYLNQPVFAILDDVYESVTLYSSDHYDNNGFRYTGESAHYYLRVPEEIVNIKNVTSPLPEK